MLDFVIANTYEYPDDGIDKWLNINKYLTKLVTKGYMEEEILQWAGELLQNVLETTLWEEHHHPDIDAMEAEMDEEEFEEWKEDMLEHNDVRQLNGTVPGLAEWIKSHGSRLYGMTGPMNSEPNALWKGPHGWSKERWEFWQKRFEWISLVTILARSTKDIAKEMAKEMARISREAQNE